MSAFNVQIHTRIDEIPVAAWNALVRDNNPLIRHEFLSAMERCGCVGDDFGWLPRHLAIYRDGVLVGAMPLYEKHNSYGEFVFDNAWADAYHRSGLDYYPKLVSAIPYTPIIGQRMLCLQGQEEAIYPLLLKTTLELAENIGASGFHCLFPAADSQAFLERHGLMVRHDCHFHWHNLGYQNFDDFLGRLSAKKRKNIRQERRRVVQAGITIRCLNGHSASAVDWEHFAHFYAQTFSRKWGVPTFNIEFFLEVARKLPDQVLLVLADDGPSCIAGALMFRSNTTLYGRHWGSERKVDGLHFEACYYQGIDFCIAQGLACFEPGVQGEHKIARGFEPTLTCSTHWIQSAEFRQPIENYVQHEREAIADYMSNLQTLSPYRQHQAPSR